MRLYDALRNPKMLNAWYYDTYINHSGHYYDMSVVRHGQTSISSPRFSQQLRYAAGAAAPCYNGNISEAVTQGNKYAYTYDHANRLTSAKYTPSAGDADYSATYAYDRNSNITALTRKGLKDIFGNYGPVDDLTMLYDGNRLWRVSDHADEVLLENSRDIKPIDSGFGDFLGLPPFSYDANGNTTRDVTLKIYGMTYNALNLPQSATISSEAVKLVIPSDASRIDYTYDGAGMKHQVVHTTVTKTTFGNKVLTRTKRDTTLYVGSRIYENWQLDRVLTPYGYIKDGVHHTFLHDYQGNVAAVVAGGSLVQRTSYYPYGLPHANAHGATANPYKYGGKEFDTFGGTDLYDFHARYHAPSTGRFMTVDPMAEKYPGISPYIYCAGNPVLFIDDDGKETKLYATKLPGAISLLDPATHTFILVSQANGDYKYYSYGSSHGGKFHGIPGAIGGQLKRMFYNQDISVIEHPAENEDKIKNVITIDPPEGMTSEEFDNKVIEVAESFGNHKSIKYFLWPIMPDRGNCNSSSFTILRKAGVSNENLKMIESQIPGIHWGTRSEKAWTKDEQDDAALEGAILRPNPIMDKLLEIIYAILNSK